jgi:hypothetical protein
LKPHVSIWESASVEEKLIGCAYAQTAKPDLAMVMPEAEDKDFNA